MKLNESGFNTCQLVFEAQTLLRGNKQVPWLHSWFGALSESNSDGSGGQADKHDTKQ